MNVPSLTSDGALAFQALELAYLEKRTSHEQGAERITVSRTQLYRLLKRATAHPRGRARLDIAPPRRHNPHPRSRARDRGAIQERTTA